MSPWPIHLINLDRAPVRWVAVSARLKQAGLAFERFPAIDAQGLSEGEMHAATGGAAARFKRPMSPGEIACYLSHIAVWQRIAGGSAPAGIVLEDDVEVGEGASAFLAELTEIPPDWDMLKFFAERPLPLTHETRLRSGHRYGVSRRLPLSTAAYALTRAAAAAMAERAIPFSRPIDLDMRHWWKFGICIKVAEPHPFFPVTDNEATSALTPERQALRGEAVATRFIRNARYQISFGLERWRHRNRQPTAPVFSGEDTRRRPS